MNCHYFNPENDLALAQGGSNYNPPQSALALARDLSILPLWFAGDDDVVLVRRDVPADWQRDILSSLGVRARWLPFSEWKKHSTEDDCLVPWGWNASLLREWNSVSKRKIEMDVNALRNLSHRRFSIEVLAELEKHSLLHPAFVKPIECFSLEEIRSFVESYPRCVLKAPWSCSGKGLRWTAGEWDVMTSAWCANILKRQRSVICEVALDKRMDFAMEFFSDGEKVSFAGYSLFSADDSGTYRSNFLLSDADIVRRLSECMEVTSLPQVAERLEKFFTRKVASLYKGYFGVDMLVAKANGECFLDPCVEVNLRMNMGVVSRIITDRFLAPSSYGEYIILANRTSDDLFRMFNVCRQEHPLVVKDGKVVSGFLPLTYVDGETHYAAIAQVRHA